MRWPSSASFVPAAGGHTPPPPPNPFLVVVVVTLGGGDSDHAIVGTPKVARPFVDSQVGPAVTPDRYAATMAAGIDAVIGAVDVRIANPKSRRRSATVTAKGRLANLVCAGFKTARFVWFGIGGSCTQG